MLVVSIDVVQPEADDIYFCTQKMCGGHVYYSASGIVDTRFRPICWRVAMTFARLSTMLSTLLFVLLLAMAGALLRHLARARIPPALEPVAVRWENAGFNPKSFRLLLWGCFWFLALIFFAAVVYGLYQGAMGLGRDFK